MRSILRLSLLGLALAACHPSAAKPPVAPAASASIITVRSADELVRAMHDRYAGRWYRTATFVQRNTRYLPSGAADTSTWIEAIRVPGALRIDIEPLAQKNGILFVRDSQFLISGGRVTTSTPSVHPLMVLAFDVYADPVERTLSRVRSLGIDLSKLHEDVWEGRPAYVVGAAAGDLRTRQFWVDRERLVFVRMLQPDRDSSRTAEIRFDAYRKLGGGWIAPEVRFLTNGKATFLERYEDVQVDPALNDALFDPRPWATVPRGANR